MTCIAYDGGRFLLPIGACFPSEVSERLIMYAMENERRLSSVRALHVV